MEPAQGQELEARIDLWSDQLSFLRKSVTHKCRKSGAETRKTDDKPASGANPTKWSNLELQDQIERAPLPHQLANPRVRSKSVVQIGQTASSPAWQASFGPSIITKQQPARIVTTLFRRIGQFLSNSAQTTHLFKRPETVRQTRSSKNKCSNEGAGFVAVTTSVLRSLASPSVFGGRRAGTSRHCSNPHKKARRTKQKPTFGPAMTSTWAELVQWDIMLAVRTFTRLSICGVLRHSKPNGILQLTVCESESGVV